MSICRFCRSVDRFSRTNCSAKEEEKNVERRSAIGVTGKDKSRLAFGARFQYHEWTFKQACVTLSYISSPLLSAELFLPSNLLPLVLGILWTDLALISREIRQNNRKNANCCKGSLSFEGWFLSFLEICSAGYFSNKQNLFVNVKCAFSNVHKIRKTLSIH